MSQEFVYDINQEMNEQFVPDILSLMGKFAVETDPKVKFRLMQQINSLSGSFMDYYDYCGEDDVA